MKTDASIQTQLVHHGAAASSSAHTLVWIPKNEIQSNSSCVVYSSHGILNVLSRSEVQLKQRDSPCEPVWSVEQTLRTNSVSELGSKRIITALSSVRQRFQDSDMVVGLTSGFSDGTVNYWTKSNQSEGDKDDVDLPKSLWHETLLQEPNRSALSITDIDGMALGNGTVMVVICTAAGVSVLRHTPENGVTAMQQIATYAANTVRLNSFDNYTILLVGTAAPRHNKICVYWMDHESVTIHNAGHLLGHEDWLTDFAWSVTSGVDVTLDPLLASASQDARIRLWKFKTTTGDGNTSDGVPREPSILAPKDGEDEILLEDDDDDFEGDDDNIEDEGEARLELFHSDGITRVTLEALLFGHEESVTSVAWHPKPIEIYHQDRVLLSSSMDRTLLIWTCIDGGVWTPLSRVGTAGGILGGSIGSTLLGFLAVVIDPIKGESLIGHAYGGALHVWTLEKPETNLHHKSDHVSTYKTTEEITLQNRWKATPCVTGHFAGVTDCCWEAEAGEYLLTVSNDQTCRLWGPVTTTLGKQIWVELARPQVHGYNLTAVSSISTPLRRHGFMSGADEKEIRVFDAPLTTIKILEATKGAEHTQPEDGVARVERAYIPSLGLSNKASAADRADEEKDEMLDEHDLIHLPLERDLGAVSLWPEVTKLFGHNTELYCLTSTPTAMSGASFDSPYAKETLVASSGKARDIHDAAIHIWNAHTGKCAQVLSGGHKSTVATLAFSPDGVFLASSGKDRRLCIWDRATSESDDQFVLAAAVETAHKRIIWSVHFCPHDPTILATGSRDGIVKIWHLHRSGAKVTTSLCVAFEATARSGKKAESVTSVAFAPIATAEEEALLAVGLENGLIEIWAIGKENYKLVNAIEPSSCHFDAVTKLSWRPVRDSRASRLVLASCSHDHGVRLFEVRL